MALKITTAVRKDEDELLYQLQWFVRLRWVTILVTVVIILLSKNKYLLGLVNLDSGPLVVSTAFIALANIIFYFLCAHFKKLSDLDTPTRHIMGKYTVLFCFQIIADYIAVTYFIVRYGFLYVNLSVLYLPHIIITCIILERKRYSYIVMSVGIAIITFLAFHHKDQLHANKLVHSLVLEPLMFILFIAGLFHFVWYLTNFLVGIIIGKRNKLFMINQQLVKMDREKQSFTLRATHELKAPFAAIQSYMQVLLKGYLGEFNDKIRDVLVKIDARCQLLSKMIKDIIQLSNLRTSLYVEKSYERVNVAQLIKSRIDFFDVRIKAKEHNFIYENRLPEGFMGKIIPTHFEILIDNLITNALQYTPEKKKIVFQTLPGQGQFSVIIKDEGIGIPKENHQNIFSEHFRCNNAVSYYQEGNGMGLAIVKEIVGIHNATISVESEVDKGTTFTVVFPN
ncbi:MAG: HAMP domain-containing sensor histidine kinase [Pseudomonadota bacterium]